MGLFRLKLGRNTLKFVSYAMLIKSSTLSMIISLSVSASASSVEYDFKRIIDNTHAAPYGTFELFGLRADGGRAPAISDGTVLFGASWSTIPGGDTQSGVFTYSASGEIKEIVQDHSLVPGSANLHFDGVSSPTISHGVVAFHAQYLFSIQGAFISKGGIISPVLEPAGPAPFHTSTFALLPEISGENIAYLSGVPPFTIPSIRVKNLSGNTVISKLGDPAPVGSFSHFLNYSISGENVAFRASYNNYLQEGLFVGNGGSIQEIVSTGDSAPSGMFTEFRKPVISTSNVAFWASFDNNTKQGVFLSENGSLTAIAKTGDAAPSGGTFTEFHIDDVTGPSLVGNTLAFQASTTKGAGIYLGNSHQLLPVLTTGQPLFGSTVQSLILGSQGLDGADNGSLTFRYVLDDGRFGVAVASPVVVPESTPLAAAIVGLIVLPLCRRFSYCPSFAEVSFNPSYDAY